MTDLMPFSFGRHALGRLGWSGYFTLRTWLMVLAVLLPFVLWVGGEWFVDLPLQGSISAYYHAGDGALRDVFVGSVVSIAALLIVYKGFTGFENWALNIGGGALVVVALVPDDRSTVLSERFVWLHGTAAVVFFASLIYVAIWRSGDTVDLMEDPSDRLWYRRFYKGLAIAMGVFVAATALVTWLTDAERLIFFLEAGGVWAFALFWYFKTLEMKKSSADALAARRCLRRPAYGLKDMFQQIPVERRP